jgi:cytochrome c-type protein NapC
VRNLFVWLFKPSGMALVYLLLIGLGFGAFSVVAFTLTMDATNTESFCTSCHEMASGPAALLEDTTHFNNKTGVRPTCSDCHVPREFLPKMWRKIQASREVWGKITGIIDTPEKYMTHVKVMKEREVARMRANDSRECRNCHDVDHMILSEQTAKAREFHQNMLNTGKTCIDCHQGITHMSPQIAEHL